MTFKEKIVRLRKIKSLTQDEFASAVGVSRQAVYKWESGQSYPEVPKLIEIKLLFGISIDDLLDDTYEVAMPEKKKKKRISKAVKEEIEAQVIAEQTDGEEELPENTDVDNISETVPEEKGDVTDSPVASVSEETEAAADAPADETPDETPAEEITEEVPSEETYSEKEASFVEEIKEDAAKAEASVTESEEKDEETDKTPEVSEPSQVEKEAAEESKDVKKKGFFSRIFSKK